ncbi:MAG: hypothetical protein ACK4NR_06425 [Micavibrio sp.]
MALTSVNGYSQQALVNPFQQRTETQAPSQEKKPEENRTQPREAASAGSQETETRNERRAESSSERSESSSSSRRGSTVDITV